MVSNIFFFLIRLHVFKLTPTCEIVVTGSILHWVHFTLGPHYTGSTLHWVHFTLDPLYTGSALHWVHFTLGPLYTGSIIHHGSTQWVHYTPEFHYTLGPLHHGSIIHNGYTRLLQLNTYKFNSFNLYSLEVANRAVTWLSNPL